MKISKLMISLSALAITACGGSDGDSTAVSKTASGKVIDGYIVGAKVFLDINNNGKHDAATEPSAISTQGGNYELELGDTQSRCLGYAPTIVDVPVGAIDEDLGPVTSAYRMVLPPEFKDQINFENRFVTPVTSSLWGSVNTNTSRSNYTCQDLLADIDKREKQAQALKHAVSETIITYNISEDDLYNDFIATGNLNVSLKAQSIVDGLKKSFSETNALLVSNPSTYAQVHYYFKEQDGTKNWYKRVYVSPLSEGGTSTQTLYKMSDDLVTEVEVLYQSTSINTVMSWGTYNQTFDIVSVDNTESVRPGCTFSENITIKESLFDYILTNKAYDKDIHELVNCQAVNLSNKIESRSTTAYQYNKEITELLGRTYIEWNEHTYDNKYDFGLPDMINVISQLDSLDTNRIMTNISNRYSPYSSDDLDNAIKVIRSKIVKDGNNEVTYWKTLSSTDATTYSRRTTYPNQTSSYESSVDGTNWTPAATPK